MAIKSPGGPRLRTGSLTTAPNGKMKWQSRTSQKLADDTVTVRYFDPATVVTVTPRDTSVLRNSFEWKGSYR